jgi:hypothetical protein
VNRNGYFIGLLDHSTPVMFPQWINPLGYQQTLYLPFAPFQDPNAPVRAGSPIYSLVILLMRATAATNSFFD